MPKFAVSLTEHSIDQTFLEIIEAQDRSDQSPEEAARTIMVGWLVDEENDCRQNNIADNDFGDGRGIGKDTYLLPEEEFLAVRRAYWTKNLRFDPRELADDYDFHYGNDSFGFGIMVLPLES